LLDLVAHLNISRTSLTEFRLPGYRADRVRRRKGEEHCMPIRPVSRSANRCSPAQRMTGTPAADRAVMLLCAMMIVENLSAVCDRGQVQSLSTGCIRPPMRRSDHCAFHLFQLDFAGSIDVYADLDISRAQSRCGRRALWQQHAKGPSCRTVRALPSARRDLPSPGSGKNRSTRPAPICSRHCFNCATISPVPPQKLIGSDPQSKLFRHRHDRDRKFK
jgi:hypothetical protein